MASISSSVVVFSSIYIKNGKVASDVMVNDRGENCISPAKVSCKIPLSGGFLRIFSGGIRRITGNYAR